MTEIHTLPPEGLVLRGEVEVAPPRQKRPRTRWFYLGLSMFMAVAVLAIIVYAYFGHAHLRSWLDLVYSLLLAGWVALLVAQVTLVFTRQTPTHRKLGMFGVGYAMLVVALGLMAAFIEPVLYVETGDWSATQAASFIILPIGDLLIFCGLFAASIAYRHRASVHKRLMVLASVALLLAPIERTTGGSLLAIGALWLTPAILSMSYDVWRHRRVHPANLVGVAVLLLGFTRVLIKDSEGWLQIGRAIIVALLPAASHPS